MQAPWGRVEGHTVRAEDAPGDAASRGQPHDEHAPVVGRQLRAPGTVGPVELGLRDGNGGSLELPRPVVDHGQPDALLHALPRSPRDDPVGAGPHDLGSQRVVVGERVHQRGRGGALLGKDAETFGAVAELDVHGARRVLRPGERVLAHRERLREAVGVTAARGSPVCGSAPLCYVSEEA